MRHALHYPGIDVGWKWVSARSIAILGAIAIGDAYVADGTFYGSRAVFIWVNTVHGGMWIDPVQ